jgi:hypothetical protein
MPRVDLNFWETNDFWMVLNRKVEPRMIKMKQRLARVETGAVETSQ